MMYKKLLAALFFTASTANFACASTRARRQPFVASPSRIRDETNTDKSRRIAFFRSNTPLTGWVKEFTGTVKNDFAQQSKCSKDQIMHECVVNYSKGLVGNF
jgi:hypothetical protein